MAEPKIRFKNNMNNSYPAWESYTVADLFDKVRDKNVGCANTNVITNSAEYGLISQKDYFDKDIAVKDRTDNYTIIKTGDFVYNPRKSSSAPMGPFNCYQYKEDGIVSPLYSCLRPKGNADTDFLLWYFQTNKWYGYVNNNGAQGGARHDRVGMTDKILMGIPVSLPCKEEQQRIARILSALESVIMSSEDEIEKLIDLKKGMLNKMFPSKGALIPETRFPGFTEKWKQQKFEDFTWLSGRRNKENLDLEPFAITNEHGFIPQSEAHNEFGYMKDTDRTAYIIVAPNSFAYNPARINVGSIGYYEGTEKVIVSSLYEVFQTSGDVYDRFLWHWFKTQVFQSWIERLQEGSVRLYFYYDKLRECSIAVPDMEEQKAIAEYFDKLDNLISIHKLELDKWKELKKGLLQQLFV